jgi:hypothetical protein
LEKIHLIKNAQLSFVKVVHARGATDRLDVFHKIMGAASKHPDLLLDPCLLDFAE